MRWQIKPLVSHFAPIAGKRETKGNESGNEQETKRRFLRSCGNELETTIGNETRLFDALRFHPNNAEVWQP